jgi:hypothetical protein
MHHPYMSPEWLSTVLEDGNAPLYRLEVKSTSSQIATTALYMSNPQYSLVSSYRPIRHHILTPTLGKEIKGHICQTLRDLRYITRFWS